jgi:hypothetical protein
MRKFRSLSPKPLRLRCESRPASRIGLHWCQLIVALAREWSIVDVRIESRPHWIRLAFLNSPPRRPVFVGFADNQRSACKCARWLYLHRPKEATRKAAAVLERLREPANARSANSWTQGFTACQRGRIVVDARDGTPPAEGIALIGGYLFSRSVSRSLARAQRCAQAVATGD